MQADITAFAQLKATYDTAAYFEEHFASARAVASREEMLAMAAELAPADGLALEFGVATGWTINQLARRLPGRTIHGFDSFEGLPAQWFTQDRGAFAGAPPKVAENVDLVVGLFEDTLPAFVAAHPGHVALLHVDCDLYESTATIFRHVGERLVRGSVILFDEYWNYPGWRQHEHRAFQEFATARGLRYRYAALVPTHQQVLVVVE
ncbi:MAG TPA: class I SAM-dependent methyltransferase [Caulobacteraceae bacterium]|nr:class I SAM-dependent methyltransferase [Caulobacteraceae bacterium]